MEQVFSQGYSSVKLYFMIGLPFETYDDLDGIVELVKTVKSISASLEKTIHEN